MSTIIDDLPTKTSPARKQNMPKMKIEFADQKGAKYSLAIDGASKENMGKLLDFIQSISGPADDPPVEETSSIIDTNFNKVLGLVQNKFRFGSFTSNDVFRAYEEHFKLKTTLSTISTYLARLAERHILTRSRNGAGWIYKLTREKQIDTISQSTEIEPRPLIER